MRHQRDVGWVSHSYHHFAGLAEYADATLGLQPDGYMYHCFEYHRRRLSGSLVSACQKK